MTALADNFRIATNIVQRDIKILFSDSFLVAIMFANFAIDLFVPLQLSEDWFLRAAAYLATSSS